MRLKQLFINQYQRIILFWLGSFLLVVFFQLVLPLELIALNIDYFLAVVIASVAIERLRTKNSYFSFGFFADRFAAKNALTGLLISIFAISIFFILKIILADSLVSTGLGSKKIIEIIIFQLTISVSEEIYFRGHLFQALREKFSDSTAIISIAVLFTILHSTNPNINLHAITNIFLAGILLGLMVNITGTLWASVSFHFGWNILLTLFLDSQLSGFQTYGIYHFEMKDSILNNILFGGSFGIEESWLTTIILLVLIIPAVKYLRFSPYFEAFRFRRQLEEARD